MLTMLSNSWTTILGFALGAVTYLAQSSSTVPATKADWIALLQGALLAGLGIVAKDATTGSRPK